MHNLALSSYPIYFTFSKKRTYEKIIFIIKSTIQTLLGITNPFSKAIFFSLFLFHSQKKGGITIISPKTRRNASVAVDWNLLLVWV